MAVFSKPWNQLQDSRLDSQPAFEPLTPEQAQAWRLKNPTLSPWRFLGIQALCGLLCAGFLAVFLEGSIAWSALYGAVVVVGPGALFAHGMYRKSSHAGAAMASFLFWELVKVLSAVILLLLATKVVPHLNWLAMLANMVFCMKIGWLALLYESRRSHSQHN